jgi:hypothetical protein
VGEEQRNVDFPQHRLRYSAKKTLLQSRMIICAHDDHVGIDIDGMLAQHLIDATTAACDAIHINLYPVPCQKGGNVSAWFFTIRG